MYFRSFIVFVLGLLIINCTFISSEVDLNIVHFNDFHARFEETNNVGGTCKTNECIGGFSRLKTTIDQILTDQPDSIVLNGGDNFQGTLWYTLFRWNVTQLFLNEIPFDAIVLGNHEFDNGIDGVVPFMKALKAPVIVSNINDTLEPTFQNLYTKSIVIERYGKRIGIIGVIVKRTNEISSPGHLKFLDESESVNAEAERLVREENVFTNIVLSHSGYDVDQRIASRAVGKIGLIVGGHSHTFLYSGPKPVPGPDTPHGDYPTVIPRSDGHQVLVVQASAFCKYLGNITVKYNKDGNVIGYSGEPIFLSHSIPQDQDTIEELVPWRTQIHEIGDNVIGNSVVQLSKENCYHSECTLGNLITDIMVHSYVNTGFSVPWTYASVAVFNAGGLRTTIEKGNVTMSDIFTTQPFGNTFDVGEMLGKDIQEMFEFSMQQPYYYGKAYADVNLLQLSGIQLLIDLSQPIGQRVRSIKIRCSNCLIPIYEDIDLKKFYRVVVPSFLSGGGDGFVIIRDKLKNVTVGKTDIDAIVDYFKAKSPVFAEIGGRIRFVPNGPQIQTRNLFV